MPLLMCLRRGLFSFINEWPPSAIVSPSPAHGPIQSGGSLEHHHPILAAIMRCWPGCCRLPLPTLQHSFWWLPPLPRSIETMPLAILLHLPWPTGWPENFRNQQTGQQFWHILLTLLANNFFHRMYLGGYQFLPVINCCWRSVTSGYSTHPTPLLALS